MGAAASAVAVALELLLLSSMAARCLTEEDEKELCLLTLK